MSITPQLIGAGAVPLIEKKKRGPNALHNFYREALSSGKYNESKGRRTQILAQWKLEKPAPTPKEGKRQPTAYNSFVKEQMGKENIKALPVKERMKVIATAWKSKS